MKNKEVCSIYDKIKRKIFQIISVDDHNYLPGKIFDIFIVSLIAVNVLLVILDTFNNIPSDIRDIFKYVETFSVTVFTIEYVLRIWTANYLYPGISTVKADIKYIMSFMALIDLLAILPFYIPFLIPIDLRVLRILRLLRLLRILKVNRYTKALSTIGSVLKRKAAQLISAVFVVLLLMTIASVLMYSLENEAQPEVFDNAFSGMWWAVATFTTVGYGDIYPITVFGKILSSVMAMLGIGLVAVPTGIISAGFVEQIEGEKEEAKKQTSAESDEINFCPYCGKSIK